MTKQVQGQRLTLLSAVTVDNGAPANGTAATETLTLAANAGADETVTIRDDVYTWKAALSSGQQSFEVLIGASASDSLDNLIDAVNDRSIVEGAAYGKGTTLHPDVFAAAGSGDTMDITAKIVGTAANAFATTETMADGSWGGATMSGGVERDGISLDDLVPGQMRSDKWSLEIVITGTGAIDCDAYLWGYEKAGTNGNAGEYSKLGSGTTRGHVNLGQKISGTTKEVFRDVVKNLGSLSDLYLEIRNRTGTFFSADATLTSIDENLLLQ